MRINPILWWELHKTVGIIPKKVVAGENPKRHPSSSRVYIEKYLQLKYTVSIPEKISIGLFRDAWNRLVMTTFLY